MPEASPNTCNFAAAADSVLAASGMSFERADDTSMFRMEDVLVAEPARAKSVSTKRVTQGQWSQLHNAGARDAHDCTVGKGGPSCYIVENAVRVLGSPTEAARELGISLKGVAQALDYAGMWPRRVPDEEREMLEHAAAMLFSEGE